MDFQIREAVMANVKGDSPQQFRETIQDAIARGDEHLLPGLGVLLEKWWQHSSEEEQTKFAEALSKACQH